MEEIGLAFSQIFSGLPWKRVVAGLIVVFIGQILLKIADHILNLLIDNKKYKNKVLGVRKIVVYIYNLLLFVLFLKMLHVELKIILGATGLLTLAIGFAARTPISNLISGVFLVFERPFVVGSIIQLGEYRGEVISRNLLSLTMRTLDNLMVRIPNEMVIGSAVSNFSHFPIRRLEVKYSLSNKDSLTRLEEIFRTVASRNSLALNEPTPYFFVEEFKDNHSVVEFQVWCPTKDFFDFRASFPQQLHRAVKASGMEPISSQVELVAPVKVEQEVPRQ